MNSLIFYTVSFFFLAILFWLLLLRWYLKNKKIRDTSSGLALSLFLVSIQEAKENKGGEQSDSFKNFILGMEQFLTGLSSIGRSGLAAKMWGQPAISLEIASHNRGSEIFFYIAFPRLLRETLENQLHGSFPDAKIEHVNDYNIFSLEGATAGAVFSQKEFPILPIKTYQKLGNDPLENIMSAFSQIKEFGEGAAIQIMLRPEGKKIKHEADKAIKRLKEGQSRKFVLGSQSFSSAVKDILSGPKGKGGDKPAVYDEELLKILEEKSNKLIFDCNIRLIASGKSVADADRILRSLSAGFLQFRSSEGNEFKLRELHGRKLRNLIESFSFRTFDQKYSMPLGVDEIAGIYHFPRSKKSAPQVRMLKSKESSPPVNLPKEGIILGQSSFRGEEQLIRIKKDDRRRHFYTIGQTGTGKSALMQNMAVQDIKNGEGVCIIDPHGETIEKILPLIPQARMEDVIYFDPGDTARPLALNMLEYDARFPEQKSLIVNELLEIFNKLFNMSIAGGPMFEQYFRNATMLVMEDPASGNTLLEIERVLVDKEFREYKLSKNKNIVVETFWRQIAEKASGEQSLANMVPYVTNKFDNFLSNEIMRPIIIQEKSSFNIRDVMDQRKILLINLSKGKLGELNSSLLGLIIVGKILMASLSRVDTPEAERKDFYLYIDEFQNVTTKSIATILSEARKYKLNLIVTHQFIGQLEEDIKKAIFGNVGSICSFRIGADDAEYIEKQFQPVFSADDLLNIDNYNAYLKLLIDGQTSKAFNIKTLTPETGNPEVASYIKNLSKSKYGRPREEIEEEIRKKHQKL